MKIRTLLCTAMVLAAMGCGTRIQEFSSADGSLRATIDPRTGDCQLTRADGRPLVEGYDSLRVVEIDSAGVPLTVCYHLGGEQLWMQFFPDMSLRSEGRTRDGKREGRWVYYFPDGGLQVECTYRDGLEEGVCTVYRENGIPYYRGIYAAGRESGTWEYYADNGDLLMTKTF